MLRQTSYWLIIIPGDFDIITSLINCISTIKTTQTLLDLVPAPTPSFWSLMMSMSMTMNSSICRGLQRLLKGLRQYVFPSTSATSQWEVIYVFTVQCVQKNFNVFFFYLQVHQNHMRFIYKDIWVTICFNISEKWTYFSYAVLLQIVSEHLSACFFNSVL